ncbi:hypothetical protein RRG08_063260 [Elysia crispata]|uniref:BTB domain-containing protein n=1 Tax=Elysia crispata TaxID=231223 RepID=A0AAE0XP28_9GAST|nr:hypothetical protein RRG08_063260 [Elysia crispata]
MSPKKLKDDVAFEKQLPDYNEKLWKGVHRQWCAKQFCDLQVVTTNGIVPMHACVWSAFSDDMAKMVKEDFEDKSKFRFSVSLTVSSEVVSYIACALYTGTFSPPKRLLTQIYSTAVYIGFYDILDLLGQYVKSNSLDLFGASHQFRGNIDNNAELEDNHSSLSKKSNKSSQQIAHQS